MTPPAAASLSPFAASLLPAILVHSDGKPVLTVEQAAAALAAFGAVGSTPAGLRKLLRAERVPADAINIQGTAPRIYATGLAAWMANDLKVDRRPRKSRGTEAMPVPPARKQTVTPSAPLLRLTAATADGFILPRGARLKFVIRQPGDNRPTAPGVRALVPRSRPSRPPERTAADAALVASFVATLDAALARLAADEDRAALWGSISEQAATEPTHRRRPGGL